MVFGFCFLLTFRVFVLLSVIYVLIISSVFFVLGRALRVNSEYCRVFAFIV